ncbi:hypothetical protein NYF14_10505 [Sphingobium sp. 10 DY56-G10]|uniref:hypothetical protein n=1 Tax=Sphingobium sp. 10 DY56-G10 TaxID=2974918 RepID=UPI00352B2104|tara:strand:+ start:578 stop:904 length:327 start_codon:yes stop_codon:yes gene_type:complete
MGSRVIVSADEPIPYGAEVFVRGRRATLAPKVLANARAIDRPRWLGEDGIIPPRCGFTVEMLERAPDLQAMADGPIMDPVQRFLPLGRISLAESKAREAALFLEVGHG